MDMNFKGPVFVVGNPRSGTTMFRLMLAANSAINIPPETSFIMRFFPRYGSIRRFDRKQLERFRRDVDGRGSENRLGTRWEVDLEPFWERLMHGFRGGYAELCESLYRFYPEAKGLGERRIWGDKNTAYHQYIEALAWLYPQAKFIHLIRDGRAVLSSYQHLEQSEDPRAPRLPDDPRHVALRWGYCVTRLREVLDHYAESRYLEVRYEDLLVDYENQISRVCHFLDIEAEATMRSFDLVNREYDLEPRAYDAWKGNTRNPLDPAKAEAWKDSLAANDIAEFENVAGRVLTELGYSLLGPMDKGGRPGKFDGEWLPMRIKSLARYARFCLIAIRHGFHL